MSTKNKIQKNPLSDKPIQHIQTQQQQTIIQYTSPLPPSEILEKYKQIGLLEKVIQLIDNQAMHRQQLEINQQNIQIQQVESQIMHQKKIDTETRLGQIFALIISISAILASTFCAYMGHDAA